MSDMAIGQIGQINQILAQIRALSAQAGGGAAAGAQGLGAITGDNAGAVGAVGSAGATGALGAAGPPGAGAAQDAAGVPFADLLRRGIDAVNASQRSADQLASAWQQGAPGVSLAQVMVETEKASVSFQALAQVRNRLISAYQDIMNMSI